MLSESLPLDSQGMPNALQANLLAAAVSHRSTLDALLDVLDDSPSQDTDVQHHFEFKVPPIFSICVDSVRVCSTHHVFEAVLLAVEVDFVPAPDLEDEAAKQDIS